MGIIGKIVGGTIGFALGGPLGAIAGAVFGHAFDESKKIDADSPPQLSQMEASQATFFVAVFSMLAKLVRVDGRISQSELDTIGRFMHHDLGLEAHKRQVAMQIFNAAQEAPQSFHDFAAQFYMRFQNQPQLLDLMIDILVRVAAADGSISAEEEDLILSATRLFNLGQNHYETIKSKYIRTASRYYHVLGAKPSDTMDAIKSRYRKLVREYHPDTIAAKGLPEEFTKFANDKFREIQEAYDAIKAERGVS